MANELVESLLVRWESASPWKVLWRAAHAAQEDLQVQGARPFFGVRQGSLAVH